MEQQPQQQQTHPSNCPGRGLAEWAVEILTESDVHQKYLKTVQVAALWKGGYITNVGHCKPPDKPGRPSNLIVKNPREMPSRKNLLSLLHSLVHIESVAIDLSWDIIARFTSWDMPKQFYDDFVEVAEDESRHYCMLRRRLNELGADYGSFAVHEGLWESATRTAENLYARLAVEHMVHEARGLDVTPFTIEKFKKGNDRGSADLLEKHILPEEVTHVQKGLKWFSYLCLKESPAKDPQTEFIRIVPNYFEGSLKPPFNKTAREAGGMTEEWYMPLVNLRKEQKE